MQQWASEIRLFNLVRPYIQTPRILNWRGDASAYLYKQNPYSYR